MINPQVIDAFGLQFSKAAFDSGVEKKSSYSLAEASSLLCAMGYHASQALLVAWQANGILEPTDQWTEEQIIGASMAMELRRIWLPFPNSTHDHKKSSIRLAREKTPHDQVLDVYDRVSRYDSLFVMAMMAGSTDQREREECFELLLGRIDLATGEFRSRNDAERESWKHAE